MTDSEMLEMAAKAGEIDMQKQWRWNPLADDGDALRLAVKLGLRVDMSGCNTMHPYACAYDAAGNIAEEEQPNNGDTYAATRRAIVRAAAEIGKEMK